MYIGQQNCVTLVIIDASIKIRFPPIIITEQINTPLAPGIISISSPVNLH